MSRLRRLSIRGVRNFGTEEDEALIRFSRPLTLILGPNGTGKTTIIEALKFATTGEFPPDSDKGKAFVHDPVYTISGNVRSSIKLEVIDKVGNVTVIIRTLESLKLADKSHLKTLDNCITRQNKGSSEIVSITNRCIDADMEASLAIGVSKPILKYVIFCHQEDLYWPFESGKAVKEKFDEIFDTVKYNRALENILQCQKELQAEILVLKSQKRTCEVVVSEVKNREKALADHNERLKECQNNVIEVETDLEIMQDKLNNFERLEENYKTMLTQKEKKEMECKMSEEQMRRLRDNIKEIFKGSTTDLQTEITCYESGVSSKVSEMAELKKKLQCTLEEESKNQDRLAEERINVGALKQQVKDYEHKMQLRNQILNEALAACGLNTVESDVTEIELQAQTRRLVEKHEEAQRSAEENQAIREQEERDVQKEVDNVRIEHSKIESQKELNEKELTNVQQENAAIGQVIKEIGVSSKKLDMIKYKTETAKNKITELSLAMNVDSMRETIQNKSKERDAMDTLLNEIEEELTALHKQTSLQTELDFHKSLLSEKETDIQKIEGKCDDVIKKLFNVTEFPNKKLKTDIEMIQQQLTNKIKTIEKQIQEKECDLSALETVLGFEKNELVKAQKELQRDKDDVSTVCDYKEFDEVLLHQFTRVKALQDKRGMCAYQGTACKEYLEQLKQGDPCCPLCHREFTDPGSVERVMREMKEEITNYPNRMKECEDQLKIQQEKYDKLLQLKPHVERILSFETVELEKLRENIEKTNTKIFQCRNSVSELSDAKIEPERNLTGIKQVLSDIIMRDEYMDQAVKVKDAINSIKMRLSDAGIDTERNVEEVQIERDELKDSAKKIRGDLENLQLNLNKHNEQLQDARSTYNELHEEQLQIQSNMQRLKQLKDQQEQLFSKEISLRDSISKLQDRLSEIGSSLQLKIEKLKSKKQEISKKAEADRTLLIESQKRISNLSAVQDEVNSFRRRKVSETLTQSEAKIQYCEKCTKELNERKAEIESSISQLKEHLTFVEVRKRELSDNMLLRETEKTARTLRNEFMELQEKLQSIDYANIKLQKSHFKSRHEALLRQRNTLIGSQEELKRNVQQCTDELNQEIYRNAREALRSLLARLMVQEVAIADLKGYLAALDLAMMKFHEKHMATVNKIIKKLWQLIYTGADTTSIEIQTNATTGVGGLKRSYNYKLIQTKRGQEIDMKGRCSAGQRVLASIIIRLALAETFCTDCGILALDEPTTNLDEENANSLADALSTIISYRSRYQKNLQFIIISHDENFLHRLANLNHSGGFYELYRKPNGLTAVRIRDTSELGGTTQGMMPEISSDDESPIVIASTSHTKTQQQTTAWAPNTAGRNTAVKRKRVFKDPTISD